MKIIPTRRFLLLTIIPFVLILLGQGVSSAVVSAWVVMGVLVLALLVDGLLAWKFSDLRLSRMAPARLHVDQPDPITWVVENPSSASLSLQLADRFPSGARAEPLTLALHVPPRSRSSFEYVLTPSERGTTSFGDLDYRIQGPLGLAWCQKRHPATLEIRCLPNLANSRAAELAERRALLRQMGSHRYRWRGAGTSFESLREYSPQDDIRWVDWKATARRGQPISRNFEIERHQQIVLLVDASRAMTTYCGHRTKFDAMLEAAILVSRAALNQGDGLGMLVFSDHVETYLHPRREQTQLKAVIENLYARHPRLVEPNFELALTLAAQNNLRRTLFVLFTDVTVNEAARRMLRYLRILTPRHLLLLVTIADETLEHNELREPRTTEDFYRLGVATELMYERTLLLQQLRQSGVEVLDSRADQVAARAIERYLELKRRLRI